jgi:membrane-bound ClpP family serine protease
MRQPLTWIAVALMLTGAILLVTDVGAAGLWIAVITIGIALVGIEAYRNRQRHHHA